MITHDELVNRLMQKTEIREEVERLEREEMPMLDAIINARQEAGLTQAEVAKRMGSSVPAISRLENALISGGKPSPSLDTLRRYANALGKQLNVSFQ
ncbi:MAG: helix-turn-helix transcriptional regulator [Gammaproteobacteria bacterium]|nr:helix-turn-helix transcriptional regulator [Gammaproteobacteria bacterium]